MKRPHETRLGFSVVVLIGTFAVASAGEVQAITFGEWATAQGWSKGFETPAVVDAWRASIDTLDGIGDYNWTATPTFYLDLGGNRITNLGSGVFTGLNRLNDLDLSDNQFANIESGCFSGQEHLMNLYLGGNQIASLDSGVFIGLSGLVHLELSGNHLTSITSGTFAGMGDLSRLYLDRNQIATIEPNVFAGLNKLDEFSLHHNQITCVGSDTFAGLSQLAILALHDNQITSIESGAFSGLSGLKVLTLGGNADLTVLNLEDAVFTNLSKFDLGGTDVRRVSLRNAVLKQGAFAALMDDGSNRTGIGELPGVTELDLGGVDFAAITDLAPLFALDDLTDLWLDGVNNLDAGQLDAMLDNLAAMEDPGIEGTLYMTLSDYNAFNATGGGLLAAWDAEPGHHVQIVPEPGVVALLAAGFAALAVRRRRW